MLTINQLQLRNLCHQLKLDTLSGVDEGMSLQLQKRIKNLPSPEKISKMSASEMESLRTDIQQLQFDIDNSRSKRTKDYAIRNMVNKNLPPSRPAILGSKNWYTLYKENSKR